jgi:hypothetical protein
MYSAVALPIFSPVSVDCKISGKLHVELSVELKKSKIQKETNQNFIKFHPHQYDVDVIAGSECDKLLITCRQIKLKHKHFAVPISCNRHLKVKFLSYIKHFCLCYKDHPVNAI